MILSPRIRQKELAGLCRRLATSLESGIDIRRVWTREASSRAAPRVRARLDDVSAAINRGASVSDALSGTDDYFPPLFRELISVGEETGRLPYVCRHLAEHYEHQIKLRRVFLAAIAWPMLQLTASVAVVGLVIWISGLLPPKENGDPYDVLGLGLVGTSGLMIYVLFLSAAVGAIAFVAQAIRRGLVWTQPIQRLLLKLPGIGRPLETFALARLAWTLHLTSEAGMDLLRALPLCLRSTHNAHYTDHTGSVVRSVRSGNEICEALADTRAFPRDFLDAIEVGERSGRLPETMAILSSQYQDQAHRALAVLTMLAGFAVWGLVGLLIIIMIFSVAMTYINTINNAVQGRF